MNEITTLPPREMTNLTGNYTETSLDLPDDITFEEWEAVGNSLFQIAKSSPWWIADWIAKGEGKFGEMYAQGLDYTSLDYATLRNYVSVANKYPKDERRKNISFSHHKAAMGLPKSQRDSLLDLCDKQKLSVKDLVTLIGQEKKEKNLPLITKKSFRVMKDENDTTVYEIHGSEEVVVATFYDRKSPEGKKEMWDDKPIQTWYCDAFLQGLKLQGYLD